MTRLVDWAAAHARMVLAFIIMSLAAGWLTYQGLPKEGEPDIEVPALFISVPFPGISAEDSETLLVKPMESELADLDGLKTMTGTAGENYAGIALEFEFGWDKTKVLADVRDAMNSAEAEFPEGAEQYSINEFNFSEFPILIVNLTGQVPERTLLRVAKSLQDRLETIESVLEAPIAGNRDEMVEVIIDPLRLEAYNVTAGELISVVRNNNQLIAAGEVETDQGTFSVKLPSSFDEPEDIFALPVKVSADRVVTLGDLADIRLTFEDREGTARFNGEKTVALQIVKRKGYNIIDTVAEVEAVLAEVQEGWPEVLRDAVTVGTSNDQSVQVDSMVRQLEGSVLTAIALVMIVVLAALGLRSAVLVGFAIPTSFLLCFILLGLMGISISNIVMFGLILAVGMLVDGAIVVVEYADRRITEGSGPMAAYTEAARRMFWPIVSSTATTLCAFLPMLFWPGVAGEFMGMLPVTLIFVLSASLIVALIYLPVMGGVAGRLSRTTDDLAEHIKHTVPWLVRLLAAVVFSALVFVGAMQALNPSYLFDAGSSVPGMLIFAISASVAGIAIKTLTRERPEPGLTGKHRRTPFGRLMSLTVLNPIGPVIAMGAVIGFIVFSFGYYGANNNGTEFFVDSEPEQALVYVRARGNLSLTEKDDILRQAEEIAIATPGIDSVFAFAGEGGINNNTGGGQSPLDTVGQVQIELVRWEDRPAYARKNGLDTADLDGDLVLEGLRQKLALIPGIRTEIVNLSRGPASAKPVHLRLKGEDWQSLYQAAAITRARFDTLPGLKDIEDTLPLPRIDFQIDVDVEEAGRYGADVAIVGGMVQLVTRGILLDTMRIDGSDEEVEIRVRLPEEDRLLSTLDNLKVRTGDGLVPLSNFVTRTPVPNIGQINRVDQRRYFDVKADIIADLKMLRLVPEDADASPTDIGLATELTAEEATGSAYDFEIAGTKGLFGTSGPRYFKVSEFTGDITREAVTQALDAGTATLSLTPLTANERIEALTAWLGTDPLPANIAWEWTGEQEDQAESAAFLSKAYPAALGLIFVILLAQFNSLYNAVLVLSAVVMSTAGSFWGMIVMGQPFSVIMTGTGIVALAGIVVNNNIVLIDTYQEFSRHMPRLEAIVRTAEMRIRPVLLTTITTMAGLTPMMFGLSLDFIGGGFTVDSPTALWWKQLATAVVFGLGIATVLTLVFTPAALAFRVWFSKAAYGGAKRLQALAARSVKEDMRLSREIRKAKGMEIIWDTEPAPPALPRPVEAAE
ncbi:efflux RND transporter permease subunit [Palleronia caenipelagi]|uniref:Efflux RND transporter permease subunit n=1 Tax=Palleronia caenipelagi TaxID=2489174 RepID=A0A547Q337_9RHOB|nr:efflux RND transporter permease subunit [Palleronia caenipelagi]TRD20802.1 efflux RND transporter permease subunit [Palleronia caenipelagi]